MKTMTQRLRTTGLIAATIVLVASAALFNKNVLATQLDGGDTIQVHFPQAYKLRANVSRVKVGFVPVGRVSGVDRAPDGSALVSVKVDPDVLAHLGSKPSAVIRPTTVLGGSYFVELAAGGDPGRFRGTIPATRTSAPVELDKVVQALQPDALKGLQHGVDHLEGALDPQGRAALTRLMKTAPATLKPGEWVLDALQGTQPSTDLTEVVSGLDATARALTARPGQLERVLDNLGRTSVTLAAEDDALATTLQRMPHTLDSTRTGLKSLDGSLQTLQSVSRETQPVAVQLGKTLDALSPVLAKARPVIHDLRYVATSARPMLTDLVPAAASARAVVDDVRGPVIDRANGPVLRWLHAPYAGKGPYAQTSSKKSMFEEITFALVDVNRASSLVDGNGHAIAFQPGVGAGSVGGLPLSLEQFVKLTSLWNFADPTNVKGLPDAGATVDGILNLLLGGKK